MCGRYVLFLPGPYWAPRAGAVASANEQNPRYNVSPVTWVTTIRQSDDASPPAVVDMWWGYQPGWTGGKGRQPINARAKTVATSPFFRSAFQKHRCLIPADGWYEWLKGTSPKQPHFLTRDDRQLLFFVVFLPIGLMALQDAPSLPSRPGASLEKFMIGCH
ncbi:SOS response-associated peptidase [Halomonas sp. FL8]|nr:SOS response-associated peptidase [Halomonas sp. McH1-25]MCP1343016.1 SOS response-associated peptidase [Halomonas sp. FL8]MCP1362438.1 SOS response-associated peptidase [Halomonas sp. BBD45]MCP1364096.1 SOS response-associated peptidase [Halomonas sp. BBD48]